MRLAIAIITASILLLAGCGVTDNLPTSSLTIRNAVSNLLLSTSQTTGTLQLVAGETQQVRVLRTYTGSNNQTETDDVTQFTNFKWDSGGGIASFDQLGNITGLVPGTAVIEAKFRPTVFEPWDICKLTVNVTAAP
jgi:hypothetical protein